MRIISVEANSSLELSLNESEGYSSLTATVRADLGHGVFTATNQDIHFRTLPEFQRDVFRFISDRGVNPRAEGTYESYIEIYGDTAHTFVRFRIGDAFCGRETTTFSLSGRFEFPQDQLSGIVRDLEAIQYDP